MAKTIKYMLQYRAKNTDEWIDSAFASYPATAVGLASLKEDFKFRRESTLDNHYEYRIIQRTTIDKIITPKKD